MIVQGTEIFTNVKLNMNMNKDVYFSADIETDGSIPGPFSMLSFALVYAGQFDGEAFERPDSYDKSFYRELKPISDSYDAEALAINGLNRQNLLTDGCDPARAMDEANVWVNQIAGEGRPVFVAFPLSFDWSWVYWYFMRYSTKGSPFGHSRCFDIKTALSVKSGNTISSSGKSNIPMELRAKQAHTHHALDDAIEQAEIFANLFEWGR